MLHDQSLTHRSKRIKSSIGIIYKSLFHREKTLHLWEDVITFPVKEIITFARRHSYTCGNYYKFSDYYTYESNEHHRKLGFPSMEAKVQSFKSVFWTLQGPI